MSNYTGPVLVVPFIGGKDSFRVTFHVNADSPEAIAKIVDRYAEDGYKVDRKGIKRMAMSNGTLTERESVSYIGPIGYHSRSAFIR